MRTLLLVLLLGCGGGKDAALGHADSAEIDEDTGARTDTDTGLDGAGEPSWWTLRADITLKKGLPVADSASLQVALLDGLLATICEAEVSLKAAADTESPDPAIYAWWRVTPILPTDCDEAGLVLPAELLVGVGELHPDIQARLITSGAADPATLNGAYASLDGGKTLLVYGAAGPDAAWAGEGSPADLAPLDDGRWSLRPVFSFKVSM